MARQVNIVGPDGKVTSKVRINERGQAKTVEGKSPDQLFTGGQGRFFVPGTDGHAVSPDEGDAYLNGLHIALAPASGWNTQEVQV